MSLVSKSVSSTSTGRSSTAIMAILNCTPDSFSDGDASMNSAAAIAKGRQLVADGAQWLDIGGESSRPGAQSISSVDECARVIPVITALRLAGVTVPISIDTTKATVAQAALAAGATAINDITAGADPRMFAVAAAADCDLILMHMSGTPQTMQQAPKYHDVVGEIRNFLALRASAAVAGGVSRARLYADPGIGFGKTVAHNLAVLRALPTLGADLGLPLVVGLSRKRFLSATAGTPYPADDCLGHPLHALIAPWCALLRVHDVAGTVRALRAAEMT